MEQIKRAISTNICVLLSEIRCDSWHDFSLNIIPLNERAIAPFPFPMCHSRINTIKQAAEAGQTFGQSRHIEAARIWNRSCTRICSDYRFLSKKIWRVHHRGIMRKISLVVEICRVSMPVPSSIMFVFEQIFEGKKTSKVYTYFYKLFSS